MDARPGVHSSEDREEEGKRVRGGSVIQRGRRDRLDRKLILHTLGILLLLLLVLLMLLLPPFLLEGVTTVLRLCNKVMAVSGAGLGRA